MTVQTTQAYRELSKINLVLSFFSDLNPGLTVQQAQTVLAVALHEGASMSELARITGLPTSTMSRHLLDLGSRNRKRGPGLGLVHAEIDPDELRKKIYTLTPKGKQMMEKLLSIVRL